MAKWLKFLLLFVGSSFGIFMMYQCVWPNYMTNEKYLVLSSAIGLFFSTIIIYGDDISKKLDG